LAIASTVGDKCTNSNFVEVTNISFTTSEISAKIKVKLFNAYLGTPAAFTTSLKTAVVITSYDDDTANVPAEAVNEYINVNFVDKIVYPTTLATESEKPWTNSEATFVGGSAESASAYLKEATGTTEIDYTMRSDDSIRVSMTLTLTKL